MKKTDNWMPLWIGDYLADTQHLERHEHGGYLLLLMAYWRSGSALPDDDKRLGSITKCTPADWKRLRPVLAEFFTVEGGFWVHGRVERELAESQRRAKSAASKASAAASARWKNKPKQSSEQSSEECSKHAPSMPQALHEQCPPPSPTSVTNVTGGLQPPPTDRDLMFSNGVPLLTAAGVAEKHARSMLAGLAKRHGESAVVQALTNCAQERPIEPVSWLQATLKTNPTGKQAASSNKHAAGAAAIFDGAAHV